MGLKVWTEKRGLGSLEKLLLPTPLVLAPGVQLSLHRAQTQRLLSWRAIGVGLGGPSRITRRVRKKRSMQLALLYDFSNVKVIEQNQHAGSNCHSFYPHYRLGYVTESQKEKYFHTTFISRYILTSYYVVDIMLL